MWNVILGFFGKLFLDFLAKLGLKKVEEYMDHAKLEGDLRDHMNEYKAAETPEEQEDAFRRTIQRVSRNRV